VEEPSRRSLAEWDAVIASPSGTGDDRLRFGHSPWHQGALDSSGGGYAEAERPFTRALELFEKLSADHPTDRFYRSEIAFSHRWLAQHVCWRSRRFTEACEHARQAAAIYSALSRDAPSDTFNLREWANHIGFLANVLTAAGQPQQAAETRRQVTEGTGEGGGAVPHRRLRAVGRSTGAPGAGGRAGWQGRAAEAEAEYREAISLEPNDGERHHNLGDVLMNVMIVGTNPAPRP
jgi:tetratricopeptide (TPR) repeat protein